MRVAALELGGSHVEAALVDVASRTLERRRLALDPRGTRDELVATIRAAAASVAGADRLGVAVPGPFDYAAGVPRMRHKLAGLYGVDLRSELAVVLDIAPESIRFLNDADAFVLGEWIGGAARGSRRVLGVTLGTGLGSAFLDGGRLRPGVELYLLEFRGSPVEDTISGRGIAARYGDGVGAAELASRARAGDRRARRVFEETGGDLGEFLRPHVAELYAKHVVVGGAIAHAWDLFGPALVAELPAAVRAARLEDAALLGAAYFAS